MKDRIVNYFAPPSKSGPIGVIVIGLILASVMVEVMPAAGIFVGILSVAIGVGVLFLRYKNALRDEDIDSMVYSKTKNLKEDALRALGITEDDVKELEPIILSGYDYNSTAAMKACKDGKMRSSDYKSILMFFSDTEVYTYSHKFSLLADDEKVNTEVYYYKDIVSVSTQSEKVEYIVKKNKTKTYGFEEFKLTTSGGTGISCAISGNANAQKIINDIRALIRKKKA